MKLFLGGDLMPARGIDQVLPHPVRPDLYEPQMRDARAYVRLAEAVAGPIPRRVDPTYVWGDALDILGAEAPDARIVNLESSVTDRGEPDRGKDVHYRMAPANVAVLAVARLDVCALANNHVLDWGPEGLSDTLVALRRAGVGLAGAGEDEARARAPAVVDLLDRGRVVVVSVATGSSGVPEAWAAAASRPGVWRLPALTDEVADAVAQAATRDRRPGDVVVVSIHWGDNWGYEVSPEEVAFARRLVDGGVDVVHGHSSHHPRPVEIYRDRAVLYGCGELLDDYEGIHGYEAYRPELVSLWILALGPDGRLASLRAVPMRIRRFRLERATAADAAWLAQRLHLASERFGRAVELDPDRHLVVR